jgi:hypothetical protein
VALILLLAGAAFVGGRLLTDRELPAADQQVVVSDSGGGVSTTGTMIEILPADEMPDRAPDVAGLFARREDNRLFVGTGALSAMKVEDRWEFHHDGPVIEVVATHDTLVYRDDTLQEFGDVPPSNAVQQVLSSSTVDKVEQNSTLSVWGTRRGERLVADVIVFFPNG